MSDPVYKRFPYNQLPLIVVTPENVQELYKAKNKIILFHAPWSGSSNNSITLILQELNLLDLKGISLFFIDIDQVDVVFVEQLLGEKSHGNGEAVFIKSGAVMARHSNNPKAFIKVLKELL